MNGNLSVIIVNYQSAGVIEDCINSAIQFPNAEKYEWIIVDNNSEDGSEHQLKDKFPFIKWINMDYNAGFARGNNAGIKYSSNNTILLLNPDMIILNDAINQCMARFSVSVAVASSVQLLYKNGSSQITGSYFVKGGLNTIFFLPYLGSLVKSIYAIFKKQSTAIKTATANQKVDWINGAFMMVKKNAIEKAGMFDEDFFLYAEEVEWCSRLKKAGEIVVFGDITSIHLQGSSINSATATVDETYFNIYDKKGLQLLVSRYLRIKKQFGKNWFLFHMIIIGIEIPIYIICSFFDNLLRFKNPFADVEKIKAYTRNVFLVWKLAPKVISGTPYFYKMF